MVAVPHVALLVDTATSWGTWIAQGAVRYADRHGPWAVRVEPRGMYEPFHLPVGVSLDGVIARVNNRLLASQIVAARLPAVDVSWYPFSEGRIPRCTADEDEAARVVFRYFRDLGFRHYAFFGSADHPSHADRTGEAFVAEVLAAGGKVATYPPRGAGAGEAALDRWLADLPRPVAVYAFDAVHARRVTGACARAGLRVPQDVAVLAGDHDELSVSISHPRLTALDPDPQRIGYEAATLLDRLMRGGPAPAGPILIPPAGVVTRESTDTLAVEDPVLAAAISYIRSHAHHPIQVTDVLHHVPMSRRALELCFRSTLGRSPAAEIRRVRLERARRLLAERGLPLSEVAVQSGFDSVEVLTRTFRRTYQQTPAAYRRQLPPV
jgi:LacI family transcriptional regulator